MGVIRAHAEGNDRHGEAQDCQEEDREEEECQDRQEESRKETECKAGRDQAREASEISFHSLRHSAVTMLKAAGVSDFIAREIVGHESAAVSRQYTHLTTDDKRNAMQRLPDITNT